MRIEEGHPLAGVGVVIPARAPVPELLSLVQAIQTHGFGAIVVVDDGSGAEFAPLYASLAGQPGVHLLRHAVNLGKGRALKTAFNYILTQLPSLQGVVTADADGQHTAAGIAAVAASLASSADSASAVLGIRSFGSEVPLRSRLGNGLTRILFRFLTGISVDDTQTGQRGLRVELLPDLLRLEGERYEYEMNMLLHLCRRGVCLVEVPVAAIYLDGNRGSHFRPVRDSALIYSALLRALVSRPDISVD